MGFGPPAIQCEVYREAGMLLLYPFSASPTFRNEFALQRSMAVVSVLGLSPVTKGREGVTSSMGFEPPTKRLSVVRPMPAAPVFHSTALYCSSLALCGMPLYSSSKRKNLLVSDVATARRAIQWEQDDADSNNNYNEDGIKIFVGNLAFNVASHQLAELFEEAGVVNMVEVVYDKETGRSRGFAFVRMATKEDADAVVERFNGYEFHGRALRVNSGPPPPKDNFAPKGVFKTERSSGVIDSSNRLFVGNLPWGVDDLSLTKLFNEHGTVVEARVVYDRETGKSRGFGFVTLSSSNEVNEAISSLNGADMDGRLIRVSVADARPARHEF